MERRGSGVAACGDRPRSQRKETAMRPFDAAAVLLLTTISPLRINAVAQMRAQDVPPAGPKFTAVSMKPCVPEPQATAPGARGRGRSGGNVTASPGALTIDCSTLQSVIDKAYVFFGEPLLNEPGPPRDDTPRVKGGPAWLRSEKFTIEAKADGSADRAMLMGPMLRAFLEERLQLKMHREIEQIPAYALTVAKGGLKIKPIGESGCAVYDPDKPPAPGSDAASARPGSTPVCGSVMRGVRGGIRTL